MVFYFKAKPCSWLTTCIFLLATNQYRAYRKIQTIKVIFLYNPLHPSHHIKPGTVMRVLMSASVGVCGISGSCPFPNTPQLEFDPFKESVICDIYHTSPRAVVSFPASAHIRFGLSLFVWYFSPLGACSSHCPIKLFCLSERHVK